MHRIIEEIAVSADGDALKIAHAEGGRFKELELTVLGAHQLFEFLRDAFEGNLNQRRSLRVPVFAFSGLEVEVRCEAGVLAAEARNVSYTGIYLELKPAEDPGLERGAQIVVTMRYDGDRVDLIGEVRRRFANGYGIFFPETLRDENVTPPDLLISVVAAMKRRAASLRNI